MGKMINGVLVGVLVFLVLVLVFAFYVASNGGVISGAVVGVVSEVDDSLERVEVVRDSVEEGVLDVVGEIASRREELEELGNDIDDALEELRKVEGLFEKEVEEVEEYKTFSVIEGTEDPKTVMLLYDLEPSQIEEQSNTIIKVKSGNKDNYEELYGYIRNSDIKVIVMQETLRIDEGTNLRRATGVSIIMKFAQSVRSQAVGVNDVECGSNIYNCADFSNHYEAQELFEECGGVDNDVHYLDGDNDGIACELLDW